VKDQTFHLLIGERSLTRIVAVLSALAKDVEWVITIAKRKKERTDDQNSSLWGVAYKALSEFTGHVPVELHDHFLRAYFGEVEYEVLGKVYTKPSRTTTTNEAGKRSLLSTAEFKRFYEFIQAQGSQMGCWVPDPDPRWKEYHELAEFERRVA
jgi:hypothetical protein